MTPSEWHVQEDAGHDEMQLAVYKGWLSAVESKERGFRHAYHDGEAILLPVEVKPEFPLISAKTGGILAFADIAVLYRSSDGDYKYLTYWLFLELKPSIKSVGGLIRQCNAIEVAAKRSVINQAVGRGLLGLAVRPVVYENEPKLSLLWRMGVEPVTVPRGGKA